MRRQDLAHILRAACAIAHDEHPLVVGSQSILGSFDEDDLPPETVMSIEADIAFLDDTDRRKADDVEGTLGELSQFHQTNAYYAEGVHLDTISLPNGWQARTVTWRRCRDIEGTDPNAARVGTGTRREPHLGLDRVRHCPLIDLAPPPAGAIRHGSATSKSSMPASKVSPAYY